MKKLLGTVRDWDEMVAVRVCAALFLIGALLFRGGAWAVEQGAPDIVVLLGAIICFSFSGLAGLLMTIRQEVYLITIIHGPGTLPLSILLTAACWLVVGYLIVVMIMHYL